MRYTVVNTQLSKLRKTQKPKKQSFRLTMIFISCVCQLFQRIKWMN